MAEIILEALAKPAPKCLTRDPGDGSARGRVGRLERRPGAAVLDPYGIG